MPRTSRFHFPAAGLWQAAAIFAPLLLLAALGARGLQLSRQDALDAARRQAERTLDQVEPTLLGAWRNVRRNLFPELLIYPDPPVPAPPSEAQTRYADALADPAAPGATDALARLEQQDSDALSPGGLPLAPLAELARLRLEPDRTALPTRAEALADAAILTHPSVLTPRLLDEIDAIFLARGILSEPWVSHPARWKHAESARAAWHLHAREISEAKIPFWLTGPDGRRWWVQPGERPRFGSREELGAIFAHPLGRALAGYAAAAVTLDGEPLAPPPGEVLAARERDGLRVAVVLASPERLFTQQRRQTVWLAGLLALALAAVGAAFWTLRRALAREQRLGQLKSDFVSSVSHELRAPVASMRLMAENLESGAVPTEERRGEYHRLIAEECRRLSALIDNVLDFARIEQDRKTYDLAETDAAALVRDALDFMQPRAAQRRQELRAELAVLDSPPVCDGLAVRQALINLLDNAIKFSPEGTAIYVDLRARDAQTWEIEVRDQGPGIAASDHAAIFERFHRLGSELRRETQGAGIGLSIVRHIAQAHGGRVGLASRSGAGSTFTLLLPREPAGGKVQDSRLKFQRRFKIQGSKAKT